MKNRKLFRLSIILGGALLASAIMQLFIPDESWLAFAGWFIFFIGIQGSSILVSQKKYDSCISWFGRLKKKLIR